MKSLSPSPQKSYPDQLKRTITKKGSPQGRRHRQRWGGRLPRSRPRSLTLPSLPPLTLSVQWNHITINVITSTLPGRPPSYGRPIKREGPRRGGGRGRLTIRLVGPFREPKPPPLHRLRGNLVRDNPPFRNVGSLNKIPTSASIKICGRGNHVQRPTLSGAPLV